MHHKKWSYALICLAATLVSCKTNLAESQAYAQHRVKHGWISEAYSPSASDISLPLCLTGLSNAELVAKRLVVVKYRPVRRVYSTIAELPPEVPAKIHDDVEFELEDCSLGKISKITGMEDPSSN